MISQTKGLIEVLDRAPIAFLTAVNGKGQPQTSPIWFHRDGDDLVIYNRPDAARLRSIPGNPKVAFNLRGDRGGYAGVSVEGTAVVDEAMPPATDLDGYVEKYRDHIAHLGWTPESFAADYSVPLRLTVTRVRAFGLAKWDESNDA